MKKERSGMTEEPCGMEKEASGMTEERSFSTEEPSCATKEHAAMTEERCGMKEERASGPEERAIEIKANRPAPPSPDGAINADGQTSDPQALMPQDSLLRPPPRGGKQNENGFARSPPGPTSRAGGAKLFARQHPSR